MIKLLTGLTSWEAFAKFALRQAEIARRIRIVEGLRGIHIAIGLNCSQNLHRGESAHGINIVEKLLTEFASWRKCSRNSHRGRPSRNSHRDRLKLLTGFALRKGKVCPRDSHRGREL